MVRITHSKSYNSNKTNNTTSKNKTMHKRQRTSNSTIEKSRKKKGNSSNLSGESFDDTNNARNDLLDDPPLDEFIMDINTSHNSTSFNNESLEESDKSPSKSQIQILSESQSCSTSFNNDDIISTGDPASHNKNSEYYTYKRTV
ncbi:unnamed protein product [Rhizophagus irregularis]|nr:unnamed protein product [Rhizophagus irregularis]